MGNTIFTQKDIYVPFMYSNQKWETSRDGDETFFLTSVILNKNKENEKH